MCKYRKFLMSLCHFPEQVWEKTQNIWSDQQCKNIGNLDLDLEACQQECLKRKDDKCSAINVSSTGCALRACPLPVPQPTWMLQGFVGYKLKDSETILETNDN